jgi:hypothetical protein
LTFKLHGNTFALHKQALPQRGSVAYRILTCNFR